MTSPEHRTPPDDAPGRVIPGHTYDGIQEYDNPMPGWWVWTFVASVVFALFYWVGISFFGVIDTYEDDLAESQAELAAIREAHAAAFPTATLDADALAALVEDPGAAAAGAPIFAAYCAACHGDRGQGLIGPNLTDAYWIHGDTNDDLYRVVTEGVPAQGMTPWETILSAEERAHVVAFVRSLEGTDPPDAKQPQGERYP